jgi:hypothetical protein
MAHLTFKQLIKILLRAKRYKKSLKRDLNDDEHIEAMFEVLLTSSDVPTGYLQAIGILTITWARIEYAIDLCNLFLIRSEKIAETQLPRPLNAKISLFKRGFKESRFEKTATEIVDKLQRLKNTRHDIIHGTAKILPEGGRRIQRFAYDDTQIGQSEKDYKFTDILEAIREMLELKQTLHALLSDIERLFLSNEVDQADG